MANSTASPKKVPHRVRFYERGRMPATITPIIVVTVAAGSQAEAVRLAWLKVTNAYKYHAEAAWMGV